MTDQAKTDGNFHKILWELCYPSGVEKGILAVKQLSEEAKIKPGTLYGKIESGKFSIDEAFRIAGVYAAHGEFQLANLILPEGYHVVPYECTCGVNGSLDDEYKECTVVLGQMAEKFDKGDRKGALKILPHAKQVFSKIEREVTS